MLYFLRGTDLFLHSNLARTMFQDRRAQFKDRLKWPVYVDQFGNERDQYDNCNPHYVIVADDQDNHLASLRLLPTMGRTMINEHFLDILDGQAICSEDVWECTRMCTREGPPRNSIPTLLAATGYLMQELEIKQLIGVFSDVMIRQYRILGARPEILATGRRDDEIVHAGAWSFAPDVLGELTRRSGIRPDEVLLTLTNSPISVQHTYLRTG